MTMYPRTRMVRKLVVGTDLKLDRTVCIAIFTLSVLCGTVAATTTDVMAWMNVTETTTSHTTSESITTGPLTTASSATTESVTTTNTVLVTTGASTASVIVQSTTDDREDSPSTMNTMEGTSALGPTTDDDSMTTITTDDGEDSQSTMNTMKGTSASGPTTNDNSLTTSTMPDDSTSGKTNLPRIRCFTCETNDTTSSCYGQQSGSQPNMTCQAGEKCWTFWFGKGKTFFNLTRSCHSDSCSNFHENAEDKFCQELPKVDRCTQCCGQNMCNEHINDGGNDAGNDGGNDGGSDGGNAVSGCLTTLVLSAVTLMIML